MPPYETTSSSSYINRLQQQQQQQQQYQGSTPASQQGSIRQQPGSVQQVAMTTTQYVREVESSRSTSITSTPDVNRVKKQIVVNDPNVNHKDVNF